jgi:hypothetical protein
MGGEGLHACVCWEGVACKLQMNLRLYLKIFGINMIPSFFRYSLEFTFSSTKFRLCQKICTCTLKNLYVCSDLRMFRFAVVCVGMCAP